MYRTFVFIATLVVSFGSTVLAATNAWNKGSSGGTQNLNLSGNWTPSSSPTNSASNTNDLFMVWSSGSNDQTVTNARTAPIFGSSLTLSNTSSQVSATVTISSVAYFTNGTGAINLLGVTQDEDLTLTFNSNLVFKTINMRGSSGSGDSTLNLNRVSSGSNLTFNASAGNNTLNVAGTLGLSGALVVTNLNSGSSGEISGTATVFNARINNAANSRFTVSGTLNLTGNVANVIGGMTLDPTGVIHLAGTGPLIFSNVAPVINGTIHVHANTLAGSNGWNNGGIIYLDGGSLVGANVTNTTGDIIGNGAISNLVVNQSGGSIVASNGILTLVTAPVQSGTVSAVTSGTLDIVPGWLNRGTVALRGGNLVGGNLTNQSGATVNGFGMISNKVVNNSGASLIATNGTLTLANGLVQNGSLVVAKTSTLDVNQDWANNGTVTLQGGTIQGGTLTNLATRTVSGTGIIAPSFVNDGTVTFAGTFSNDVSQNGGTFTLTSNSTVAGTFTVNGGTANLTSNNTLGAVVVNAGNLFGFSTNSLGSSTILLAGGQLNLRNNGSGSNGTITYGNDVEVTGNATIDLNRASGSSTNNIVQLGSLTISNQTLTVTTTNSYDLRFTGGTTLNGDAILSPSTADLTLAGVVSGAGSLTKTGSGALNLSNANTYAGGTFVNAGQVNVFTTNSLGSGGITLGGGQLNLRNNGSGSNGTITYGQDVVVTSSSTVDVNRISGSNTGNTNVLGSLTIGNQILTVSGGNGYSVRFDGPVSMTGNATFNPTTASLNLAGGVTGAGSLTKNGAGTLILGAASSYAGDTIVSNGILRISADDALSTSSLLSVNGGTFDVNGFHQTVGGLTGSSTGHVTNSAPGNRTFTIDNAGNGTFSGSIGGNLNLVKTGAGTQTLSGLNRYSGNTILSNGMLQIGTDDALPTTGSLFIESPARLNLNGRDQSVAALYGSGIVTNSSGSSSEFTIDTSGNLTNSVSLRGNLDFTKDGAGTLLLLGTHDFSGDVTVNQGILQIGADNTIPVGAQIDISTGDQFDLNGFHQTVTDLDGNGSVTNSSGTPATLTVNTSSSQSFSGRIRGNLDFVKTGGSSFTLNGPNDYSGSTTISNGTLRSGTDNALPSGTVLTIASGGSFDPDDNNQTLAGLTGSGSVNETGNDDASSLIISNTADYNFAGFIAGEDLAFIKQGTGIFTMSGSGANTYDDGTTVSQGELQLGKAAGVTAIPGNVTVGSGPNSAILRLLADSQIANSSTVTVGSNGWFDLNGFSEGVTRLNNSGDVTLGGGVFAASIISNAAAGVITGPGILSNAVINLGEVVVTNGSLTVLQGWNNNGLVSMRGGVLAGSTLTNLSTRNVTGYGILSNALVNNGFVTASNGTLQVAGIGGSGNFGALASATLVFAGNGSLGSLSNQAGSEVQVLGSITNGSSFVNQGSFRLLGGTYSSAAAVTNLASSTVGDFGTLDAKLVNLGTVTVTNGTMNFTKGIVQAAGAILNVENAALNAGVAWTNVAGATVNLHNGTIAGSLFENDGLLFGNGLVSAPFINFGTVTHDGAGITFSAVVTNTGAGTMDLDGGVNTFAGPLVNNGNLLLGGGSIHSPTFQNNGSFEGHGTINAGTHNVGNMHVSGGPTTFALTVTNAALFTVTNAVVVFSNNFVNLGTYLSDPSTNIFVGDYTLGPNGSMIGGTGDVFEFQKNFYNDSTNASLFDLAASAVEFTGGGVHTNTLAAMDTGTYLYGGAFRYGSLSLGSLSDQIQFLSGGGGGTALYIRDLDLFGDTNNVANLFAPSGITIYYLAGEHNTFNSYLLDQTYILTGGGLLTPAIPEPTTMAFLLTALALFARRGKWQGSKRGRNQFWNL